MPAQPIHRSSSMPIPDRKKSITFSGDTIDTDLANVQNEEPPKSASSQQQRSSQPPRSASQRGRQGKGRTSPPNVSKTPTAAGSAKIAAAGNLQRSQTAPNVLKRSGTANKSMKQGQSQRAGGKGWTPEEPDMWEHYNDPDQESEPRWELLITPGLKRAITRSMPAQERKKYGNEAAELTLKHWLFVKKLQVDANRNKLEIRDYNLVEIDAELLLTSPTFDEFVDALVTICKMKSGGVWDVDQKAEMLVGVYGREKKGSLTRDEFADVLKKHARVRPPPPGPKFETEEEEFEYQRKVKRGEIKVEKHMNQQEYELYLYRWLKKAWPSWNHDGGFLELKDIILAVESNETLAEHFTIDILELVRDMAVNDSKLEESVRYLSISDASLARYEEQLQKHFPEKSQKFQDEIHGRLSLPVGLSAGGSRKSMSRKSRRSSSRKSKRSKSREKESEKDKDKEKEKEKEGSDAKKP
ncbi:hypothetical protein TrVE_jg5381 [Triparma verrucosa]|uniref:Uncharacterized protein n=1 Tax=Triparma verrucosa TaxID=1606542 RepID=A0A9W7B947_9STRA|nr:hypothetical protein TrVE_jg5381 [Triparma verrucosa]